LIVERRVGFTLRNPVEIEAIFEGDKETEKEKQLVKLVERIQNDNKMGYRNKEILRRALSELEVAVIWFFVESGLEKPKYTLKSKIFSPVLGDTLYPLFDSSGSMISFARAYKLIVDDKEINHFDIYTDEFEYKYAEKGGAWVLDETFDAEGKVVPNPTLNPAKKMLIEYYQVNIPIWSNVQTKIERKETLESNHADMNDYFGSPMMAVSGEIEGFAAKGEQGKILQLAQGAEAKYLALSSPPESIKMERENLTNDIYSESQTPNISFSEMKDLGNIAEVTMKSFFMDAHMAVASIEEWFGIGLQRRLNLIKAAIGTVIDTSLSKEAQTVQLVPKITPYLPQNTTEKIDNLSVAVTGGIMSKETAIRENPLVADPDIELERMKDDQTAENAGL
jgi:SPP1 family phage portal protein